MSGFSGSALTTLHLSTFLLIGLSLAYWVMGRLLNGRLFFMDRFWSLSMKSQGTPSDNKATSSTWKTNLCILLLRYSPLLIIEMETKVSPQYTVTPVGLAWPRAAEEGIVFALCASSTVILLSLMSYCLPKSDRKRFSSLYLHPLTI